MTVQVLVPWRDAACPYRAAARVWTHARWAALGLEVVEGTCPDGPWNIAAALNDCLAKATADTVLLMGADTALVSRLIDATIEAAHSRWVLPAGELLRLTPHTTEDVLRLAPLARLSGFLSGQHQTCRRGWGPVAGPLELLRSVPYDERFSGWGGEDEAAWLARSTLCGPPVELGGTAFLLWHPPVPYHDHYNANLALLERYDEAAGHARQMAAVCGFTYAGKPCSEHPGHSGAHLCA